jgi:hypothetical protein
MSVAGFNEFSASSIAEALANGTNIATIKDTQIRIFLDSDEFSAALDSAIVADIAAHGTSSSYYNRSLDQVMLGQDANGVRVTSDSFWDDASRHLVEQHSGPFELIMPNGPDGSIAFQTEIPTLLEKSGAADVTINGISLYTAPLLICLCMPRWL